MIKSKKMQEFYLNFQESLNEIVNSEFKKNMLQMNFFLNQPKDPKTIKKSVEGIYPKFSDF